MKSVRALTLSFVAIALIGVSLNACSESPQTQAEHTAPHHTGHGGHAGHHEAMNLGTADASYDLRFIDAMIVHHQGAVDMAKAAQQQSQRPEIRQLADEIIQAQDREIQQMQQWRQAWYPNASAQAVAYNPATNSTEPMSEQQRQSMMMSMDLGAADEQFDLRFINAMIPHHEGAVEMANDASTKSNRPEIKQLSEEIVTSQQQEIQQMQQWRQAWYNQ